MKNKKKLLTLVSAAVAAVILIVLIKVAMLLVQKFSAPSETGAAPSPSPTPVKTVEFAETEELDQQHLRENKFVYDDTDPYDVVTMYLTVSTGNPSDYSDHTWSEVNSLSAYYYDERKIPRYRVAALLQVGDETGPLKGKLGYGQTLPNATVQIRGQTSSRNEQKNYKIALKDNSEGWRGQKTIALNKHQTEGMRFRNKLCFDLLSTVPQMTALRTQFVHLYVKDTTKGGSGKFEDYGLYTQVEQPNRTFLRAHGLDPNGELYKINFFEFLDYEEIKNPDEDGYDESAFNELLEPKTTDNHDKLKALIKAVNDYSITNEELLDRYFDSENLAYWMAAMMLLGNSDTQNRNCYIYSPKNGNKWYFLPWDCDATFMRLECEFKKLVDFTDWEKGVSNYWGNALFKRALMSDSFRAELDKAVEDLYKNYLTPKQLNEKIKRYSATTRPFLERMPDQKYAPLSKAEYDKVLKAFPDEVKYNYDRYKITLVSPMPFFVLLPQKTKDGMEFSWELSTDFKDTDIVYHAVLAKDYELKNKLQETTTKIPSMTYKGKLEPGQYFLHVDATNEAGYTMNCLDYYSTGGGSKAYGIFSFFVDKDGKSEADTREE